MKPRSFLFLVMLIPIAGLLSGSPVYGFTCQTVINKVEYPAVVAPGAELQVTTNLSLTCTTATVDISGRVDLIDLATNKTLSVTVVHVGTISASVETLSYTVSNVAQAPARMGPWNLAVTITFFAASFTVASTSQPFAVQIGQTSSSTSSEASSSITSNATTSQRELPLESSGLFFPLIVAGIVAVIVIASILVLMRKKEPPSQDLGEEQVSVQKPSSQMLAETSTVTRKAEVVRTGYPDLDGMLEGGLPVGHSILFLSPPCDEKDLLFHRIIESSLFTGWSVYFMSRDLGRTEDLLEGYKTGFYALCTQADKVRAKSSNVFPLGNILSLNDISISFLKAFERIGDTNPQRLLILDILSDVLVEHEAAAARIWLDEWLAKRKAEGFTVLATLNSMIASKQATQKIVDLFDGIVEIYEKHTLLLPRRFLIIKKLSGRRYVEKELMLDKDRLF
jgi:KaiC/GvpD/RAD55 family RecA-like ATPase